MRSKETATSITTTLPYINSTAHIGFALELVMADAWARTMRNDDADIVFNTGTDEHGLKILRKADSEGLTAQEYCDKMAVIWRAFPGTLNVNFSHFIRTTDSHHITAAQEFWRRCRANGDIYKKEYTTLYCVGCESEKTLSDLVNGRCPDHPTQELEEIKEENYFFRFSRYQDQLLALYDRADSFVVPVYRLNEIRSFVRGGLTDFSISRLAAKMPWGIPVPDDEEHVMYVWFDALVNYISTIGWPDDAVTFQKYWPMVQIAGKDNLRHQSAMWQAMLLSAGLPPSCKIFIHGHITVDGQKMSKSLGNVIAPEDMIARYGVDGTRYLLLTLGVFGSDADASTGRFDEKYTADLVNGLGNLLARTLTLITDTPPEEREPTVTLDHEHIAQLAQEMEFCGALGMAMDAVRSLNKVIDEQKPWILKKDDQAKFIAVMAGIAASLREIAKALKPFLPTASERMADALVRREKITLFPRLVG